jgi:hypothetical protein
VEDKMAGFYDPLRSGPDWGGGLQDLIQQFLMFKMISQMYPDEKGKKGKETPGISKVGEMFFGEPLAKEIQGGAVDELISSPMGQPPLPPPQVPQLPMGQMGQTQQQPGIDIQQIMQMLGISGMLPGTK